MNELAKGAFSNALTIYYSPIAPGIPEQQTRFSTYHSSPDQPDRMQVCEELGLENSAPRPRPLAAEMTGDIDSQTDRVQPSSTGWLGLRLTYSENWHADRQIQEHSSIRLYRASPPIRSSLLRSLMASP
jgi:hypothetical protein